MEHFSHRCLSGHLSICQLVYPLSVTRQNKLTACYTYSSICHWIFIFILAVTVTRNHKVSLCAWMSLVLSESCVCDGLIVSDCRSPAQLWFRCYKSVWCSRLYFKRNRMWSSRPLSERSCFITERVNKNTPGSWETVSMAAVTVATTGPHVKRWLSWRSGEFTLSGCWRTEHTHGEREKKKEYLFWKTKIRVKDH